MCQIIQFPATHSNAYLNLVDFFEITENANACSFYLEVVERADLTDSERYGLRRIGRQKLRKLSEQAAPKVAQPEPASPGAHIYHPDMHESRPNCQISASLSHYGDHWYLDTDLELKGRGIRFIERTRRGNQYIVTERAFEQLKKQYSIAIECLLD
jgi:hypothetical protein